MIRYSGHTAASWPQHAHHRTSARRRTTARRTIAASETAYDMLSNQFLFRPRGSYFLPETGNMRTFVMVGRI